MDLYEHYQRLRVSREEINKSIRKRLVECGAISQQQFDDNEGNCGWLVKWLKSNGYDLIVESYPEKEVYKLVRILDTFELDTTVKEKNRY